MTLSLFLVCFQQWDVTPNPGQKNHKSLLVIFASGWMGAKGSFYSLPLQAWQLYEPKCLVFGFVIKLRLMQDLFLICGGDLVRTELYL